MSHLALQHRWRSYCRAARTRRSRSSSSVNFRNRLLIWLTRRSSAEGRGSRGRFNWGVSDAERGRRLRHRAMEWTEQGKPNCLTKCCIALFTFYYSRKSSPNVSRSAHFTCSDAPTNSTSNNEFEDFARRFISFLEIHESCRLLRCSERDTFYQLPEVWSSLPDLLRIET